MRQSLKCPKCQGQQFHRIGACTVTAHDSNGTEPLSVAAAYLPTGERGFLGGEDHARFVAQLQAVTCSSCGFTEFYVGELEVLAYMVQHTAGGVRFIDGSVGTGGASR